MIFFWGWRIRKFVLSRGEFFCPGCHAPRGYRLMEAAKYFTFYFIPIFRTSRLGEYVECDRCGRTYNEEVLDYHPTLDQGAMPVGIRADLESGTPLEMVARKLINGGQDEREARRLVAEEAGEGRWSCQACRLSYIAEVARCSQCGKEAAVAGRAAYKPAPRYRDADFG